MSNRYDCLSVGIVVADHVCEPVDHLPAPGELVLTRRMELTIGGCASNVACDLARLGRRAALSGLVGDDVFGSHVRTALTAAGVDCTHLGTAENCDTAGTLIINCRGQDRRFIHSIGANGRFTAREISSDLICSARTLYFGGYCLCDQPEAENVAALFREAQSAGIPTLLDVVIPGPGDYWSRLAPVLPYTDVFLPNDDEGRIISGIEDPVAQARAFHQAGAKTVVVTCGAAGAVAVSEKASFRVGGHSVPFVDGTGSGDAFVAGFLEGLLRGADLAGCVELGSALGASCVTAVGATTGIFTTSQLDAFVREHPLKLVALPI